VGRVEIEGERVGRKAAREKKKKVKG